MGGLDWEEVLSLADTEACAEPEPVPEPEFVAPVPAPVDERAPARKLLWNFMWDAAGATGAWIPGDRGHGIPADPQAKYAALVASTRATIAEAQRLVQSASAMEWCIRWVQRLHIHIVELYECCDTCNRAADGPLKEDLCFMFLYILGNLRDPSYLSFYSLHIQTASVDVKELLPIMEHSISLRRPADAFRELVNDGLKRRLIELRKTLRAEQPVLLPIKELMDLLKDQTFRECVHLAPVMRPLLAMANDSSLVIPDELQDACSRSIFERMVPMLARSRSKKAVCNSVLFAVMLAKGLTNVPFFSCGESVVLRGLMSRPLLNGTVAVVVSTALPGSRVAVLLDNGEVVSVLSSNLLNFCKSSQNSGA